MSSETTTITALENLKSFVDSPIVVGLLGIVNSNFGSAALGAFFGAIAAYLLSLRLSKRDRLLVQLQATNAAASWSIATFNHTIGFKKQLVIPLVEDFETQAIRYQNFVAAGGVGAFAIEFNHTNLDPPSFDTNGLCNIVSEKCAAQAMTIMASLTLHQCYETLRTLIVSRTVATEALVALKGTVPDELITKRYLGVRDRAFGLDTRYKDAVEGISTQVDSILFFHFIFRRSFLSTLNR